MNMLAAIWLILGVSAQMTMEVPRLVPFFSRVDDGPAFFVECRNTSPTAVPTNSRVWAWPLRIDGRDVPEPRGVIGPGLSTNVEPGETWRGIVALRQSDVRYFPDPKFGAMSRSPLRLQLTPGHHTVVVSCQGVWSHEVEFYWEDESQPHRRPAL